ncbi:GP46-like surface antigen, putative, partial [Bodo saltans]
VDWFGVNCSAGDVVNVTLGSNNLTGTLPSSWWNMTNIVHIVLSANSLVGTLPSEWSAMAMLSTLDLSTNRLSGILPGAWSAMTRLTILYLQTNSLSGSLPAEWSALTTLQTLYLSTNSLTSSLPPEWSSMTQITLLALNGNMLNETLPNSWSALTKLEGLFLSSNNLSGTLPSTWSAMTRLQGLYLSANSLSGTLPSSWSNMTSMVDLELIGNSFAGSLPSEWSGMAQITTLALYRNSLTGSLPAEWSSMTQLANLALYSNSLSGTLPSSWSAMTRMISLSLYSNSITGTLPPEWSSMVQMTTLVLNYNMLTGTLPGAWSAMTKLSTLYLQTNSLTGSLPAAWSAMSTLQTLYLSSNSFAGSLPPGWSAMILMTTLVLNGNSIIGTLPSVWSAMTKLSNLLVQTNSLTGSIPQSWTSMSSLRGLNLGSNCLSGAVPASLLWNLSGALSLCNTKLRGGTNLATRCAGSDWPLYCYRLVSQSATSSTSRSSPQSITFTLPPPASRSSTPSLSLLGGSTTSSTSLSPTHLSKSTSSTVVQCAVAPPGTVDVWLAPPTNELLVVPNSGVLLAMIVSGTYVRMNNTGSAVNLVGSPIERRVLTSSSSSPSIGLNISLLGPLSSIGYWKIGNVSSLVNHQLLSYEAVSSNTVSWNAAVVLAPASGWISASVPLLVGQTFYVNVTLMCYGASMLHVLVAVPAPGVPQQYAQLVKASSGYAQVASIIAGGASSGSALGRVLATRSMVLCNADAALGGGVIDLNVNICDIEGASDNRCSSHSTLCDRQQHPAPWLCGGGGGTSLRSMGLSELQQGLFSSSNPRLVPSFVAAIGVDRSGPLVCVKRGVPSCRATISSCVGVDVVLGVLGLLVAIVPCAVFALLWCVRVAGGESATWVCVAKHEEAKHNHRHHLLHRLLRRRYEWRSALDDHEGRATPSDIKAAWVVLLEYRELRYGALDAGVLAAVSCVSVLSGLNGSTTECRGWGLMTVLLMTAQLVVLCALRPLTSMCSMILSCATLLLTILGSLLQLVFVWAFSTNTCGLWLIDVSAVLSLIVVGVSIIKMGLDFFQLMAAIRRRIVAIAQPPPNLLELTFGDSLLEKSVDSDALRFEVDTHTSTEEQRSALMMTEFVTQHDERFWDTSGAALGTELVDGHSDILR